MAALAQSSIPTDLLTVPEVAALMRVSINTVYGWISRGLVTPYGVGQTVRLSGAELARPRPNRRKQRVLDQQRLKDLGDRKLSVIAERTVRYTLEPATPSSADTATLASSDTSDAPTGSVAPATPTDSPQIHADKV